VPHISAAMVITKAVAVGISVALVVTGCRVVLADLAMSRFSPVVRQLREVELHQDLLRRLTRARHPLQVPLELDQL
jgi:hypothetical protein